jgi:hypothetical protein
MKRRIFFVIIATIIIMYCNDNRINNADVIAGGAIPSCPFQTPRITALLDLQLILQKGKNTFHRLENGRLFLYSKELNGITIGFVALTDSTIWYFQKLDSKWHLRDSIKFESTVSSFELVDLNGDSMVDVIIHVSADIHGQTVPFVFMANAKGALNYRKDIKLYNLSFDPKKQLVRSFYVGCAYCLHHKALYRWVNDSLRLLERVEMDLTNENHTFTRFYKAINGRLVNYKTSKDAADYDQALWGD